MGAVQKTLRNLPAPGLWSFINFRLEAWYSSALNTMYSRRYLVFRWSTNCWYFDILSISALLILLLLPILDICTCRYCPIPSILIFDIGYTACWKWETKNNIHVLIFLSPLCYCFISFPFSFLFGDIFPFWKGYFPFGFFRVARWCALLVVRRPYIDVLSFPFTIFSFISSSSFLFYFVRVDGVTLRDAIVYSVLKGQGWRALSLCSVVRCSLSKAEYHCGKTKRSRWSILLIPSERSISGGRY